MMVKEDQRCPGTVSDPSKHKHASRNVLEITRNRGRLDRELPSESNRHTQTVCTEEGI